MSGDPTFAADPTGDLAGAAARVHQHDWRLTIGGSLRPAADGATMPITTPATGEVIATVPAAGAADADLAVAEGMEAGRAWRARPPRERARIVRGLADVLRANRDDLALLDAIDCGNPVTAMRGDVDWACDVIELFADLALGLRGETIPATTEFLHMTERVPYGIVVRIVPFNHPIFFAAAKIAAPLVAGNAVVLKPSDQAPLSALRMGELFADVLPPGILSVLSGEGRAVGTALVRHPDVKRIAFIGGETTGRRIQVDAAESGVKHVSLELGGKNALIALPDSDPDFVARTVVAGMNFAWSQGQSCGSTSRLLVHRRIEREVVDRVVDLVRALRVGSPLDETTEMGPLITSAHLERVSGLVAGARDAGARLATGGGRPAGLDDERGWYLEPTVFDAVDPGMEIASTEVFGPVLSVIGFDDVADAVEIANGVRYGLTGSVCTNDIGAALSLVRELDAGYLWVNGASRHFWGTPFGGVKASGIDREESLEELVSFTELKSIHVMGGQR